MLDAYQAHLALAISGTDNDLLVLAFGAGKALDTPHHFACGLIGEQPGLNLSPTLDRQVCLPHGSRKPGSAYVTAQGEPGQRGSRLRGPLANPAAAPDQAAHHPAPAYRSATARKASSKPLHYSSPQQTPNADAPSDRITRLDASFTAQWA